jgi:hypothetical protein
MSLDSNAISTGPGVLYAAPIATSDPTDATSTLPSVWRRLGYTEEGNVFTYGITTEAIFVAELLDPVRIDTTKREGALKFAMAEMTRENFALALNAGANAANDATLIEPPDIGTEVRVKLVLQTQGGARYIFRRCIQGGTLETARKKSPDKALLQVEFQMEVPTGARLFGVYPAASGYLT